MMMSAQSTMSVPPPMHQPWTADGRLGRVPELHVGVDEARDHAQIGDGVPHAPALSLFGLRLGRPVEAVARAEGGALGAEQDDADGGVGVGLVDRGRQLVAQRRGDRVVLAGPCQHDRAHAGLGLGADRLHRSKLPWRPAPAAKRAAPASVSPERITSVQRRQNTPKTASVAATRRSHQSASSRPPATAYPSTAAMTGFPSSMRVGPMGPSPSSLITHSWPEIVAPRRPWPAATAFRSAPAQNVPPAPVRTATASPSSASKRRNASTSAAAVGSSTALRTSGRLMVTTATSPSVSNRTVLMRVLPLPAGCLLPLQEAPPSREARGWTR